MSNIKKVKVLKQMSFKDLVNLKVKIPVNFKEESIFELEELTSAEFAEFVKRVFTNTDIKENVMGISQESICYLMRRMCRGIEVKGLTDTEIIETITNLGGDIQTQITEALKVLVMGKLEKFISEFTASIEKSKEVIEDAEQENKE